MCPGRTEFFQLSNGDIPYFYFNFGDHRLKYWKTANGEVASVQKGIYSNLKGKVLDTEEQMFDEKRIKMLKATSSLQIAKYFESHFLNTTTEFDHAKIDWDNDRIEITFNDFSFFCKNENLGGFE